MEKLVVLKLKELVPSAFATQPVLNVSSKYSFVPSQNLVTDLEKLNWYPVSAKQDNPRLQDATVVKHMIRFRNKNSLEQSYEKDELIPEIVLLNSHNRSFRFQLTLGIFRVVCSNGMVVCDSQFEKINVRHIGVSFIELESKINELVESFGIVMNKISDYKKINLSYNEKIYLATQAAKVAWRDSVNSRPLPSQLLVSRRPEDEGDSLWNTFNVIQENITKGGLEYTVDNKKRTTREVLGIQREFIFNKQLWFLMEAMRISKM